MSNLKLEPPWINRYEGPKAVLAIIVALFGIPYGWWANAYALEHIWNWYVPPFAPAMTLKVALGASFVASALLLGFTRRSGKKNEDYDKWTALLVLVVSPWAVLVAARICLWMFFE